MKIFQHYLKWLYHQWKELLKNSKYRASFFLGATLLIIAYVLNFQASLYTEHINVLSVGDLILDHIPTVDLSYMYTFGIYITLAVIFIYPLFFRPEIVPFGAKTYAAFLMTRAFFISLTHLGAPANYFRLPQLQDQQGLSQFFYTNDLFFSGHTGLPFLAALLFWDNRFVRYFMIGMSISQGITVLFMHVHYSIDVFSAYFITYTIFIISDRIFNKLNLSFKKIAHKVEEKLLAE